MGQSLVIVIISLLAADLLHVTSITQQGMCEVSIFVTGCCILSVPSSGCAVTPPCDNTAAQTEPVHLPMSLWARTAAQGDSSSTHVPMSLIGRGPLCRRMIWKGLE